MRSGLPFGCLEGEGEGIDGGEGGGNNMIHDASWKLPDPFLKEDGNRISSKEEWGAQRIRFLDMLEKMF